MPDTFLLPNIADGEDKTSIFANRIRNNYRHIKKWAKRTHTNCFRIYDREIHHFPLAIDFYDGRFCIQYFSKSKDEFEPPQHILDEVSKALKTIFDADPHQIFWRLRKKRKETRQYEKSNDTREFFQVLEYGVRFNVNLQDYLDTGLFLDHRETRQIVASVAKGKRILNLFAYTCSFSVQAAAKGASYTKSVDMSNTYTQWGQSNFRINGMPSKNNEVVRADCMKFLDLEIQSRNKYDIIVIDPPTISRSKKMDQLFDVQIDYVSLLKKGLEILSEDGVIFFSTNSRKFVFDESLFPNCNILEITNKTIPIDFHDKRIHRCWKITKV